MRDVRLLESDDGGPELGQAEPERDLSTQHAALAGRRARSCALARDDEHETRAVALRAAQEMRERDVSLGLGHAVQVDARVDRTGCDAGAAGFAPCLAFAPCIVARGIAALWSSLSSASRAARPRSGLIERTTPRHSARSSVVRARRPRPGPWRPPAVIACASVSPRRSGRPPRRALRLAPSAPARSWADAGARSAPRAAAGAAASWLRPRPDRSRAGPAW